MGRRCPRGLEPPPRSAPARSGFGSSIGYHPAAARPDHWAASARPRSPGFRSKGREPRRPVGVSSHCGATGHSTFPPTRETPARRRVQCHWGHPGHRCPRTGVGSPLGSQQLFWKWLKTPMSDPPPRPPPSSKDPGGASTKEGVSLRVPDSLWAPGVFNPLPPSCHTLRDPSPPLESRLRTITPALGEHTRNCRSPNSGGRSPPCTPGSARSLTARRGSHAEVSGALRGRGAEGENKRGVSRTRTPSPAHIAPSFSLFLLVLLFLLPLVFVFAKCRNCLAQKLRRRRLEPGKPGGGVRMGAVSGTPSPGCNGRGRRAGRGGAARGREPGRAGAGRAPQLRAARPFLRPAPAPRGPAPPSPPPPPRPRSLPDSARLSARWGLPASRI